MAVDIWGGIKKRVLKPAVAAVGAAGRWVADRAVDTGSAIGKGASDLWKGITNEFEDIFGITDKRRAEETARQAAAGYAARTDELRNMLKGFLDKYYPQYLAGAGDVASYLPQQYGVAKGAYSALVNRTLTAPSRLARLNKRASTYGDIVGRMTESAVASRNAYLDAYRSERADLTKRLFGYSDIIGSAGDDIKDMIRKYNELVSGWG